MVFVPGDHGPVVGFVYGPFEDWNLAAIFNELIGFKGEIMDVRDPMTLRLAVSDNE